MIFVSHQLPVNTDGEAELTGADLWAGLVMKAVVSLWVWLLVSDYYWWEPEARWNKRPLTERALAIWNGRGCNLRARMSVLASVKFAAVGTGLMLLVAACTSTSSTPGRPHRPAASTAAADEATVSIVGSPCSARAPFPAENVQSLLIDSDSGMYAARDLRLYPPGYDTAVTLAPGTYTLIAAGDFPQTVRVQAGRDQEVRLGPACR